MTIPIRIIITSSSCTFTDETDNAYRMSTHTYTFHSLQRTGIRIGGWWMGF